MVAHRNRLRLRTALFVVTLTAFVLSLAPLLHTGRSEGSANTTTTSATPSAAAGVDEVPRAPQPGQVEFATIGRQGTLSGTLDRLGVPGEIRQPLLDLVAGQIDLRRLPTATGVGLSTDGPGNWRQLAIRPQADRYLQIDLPEPGTDMHAAVSRWIEVPVEIEVATASAAIEQSVAQALEAVENGRFLTTEFADIFQWDVDLLIDPRPGDQVHLVYEVHRLGAAPALLPPFGDAPRAPGELLGPGRVLAASYQGEIARAQAFWVPDDEGGGDYYDADGRKLRKTFLKSPLNYRRISSRFSRARRNPVTRRVVPHHGVDYAADAGTPVVAAADGRIDSVGWDGPLGKAVRIRHGSEHVTIYGHLRSFAKGIQRGAQVRQNDVIGYVGATGRATGPHLHYTVVHRGKAIDPLKMENPPEGPLDPALYPVLAASVQRWSVAIELAPDAISTVASRSAPEEPPRGAY